MGRSSGMVLSRIMAALRLYGTLANSGCARDSWHIPLTWLRSFTLVLSSPMAALASFGALAGFDVVGVDHKPQPRYPFPFREGDALETLTKLIQGHDLVTRCGQRMMLKDFAAIHASPPCQRYSWASFTKHNKERHPDLIAPTRTLLEWIGKPWVIENVVPSPLSPFSITLCGLMFGLKVFRHRRFESSAFLWCPPRCSHRGKVIGRNGMCCVVGHGGGVSRKMREHINRHGYGGQQNKQEWQVAMGIDWMTRNEMSQAIPPVYTEFIGRQLMEAHS